MLKKIYSSDENGSVSQPNDVPFYSDFWSPECINRSYLIEKIRQNKKKTGFSVITSDFNLFLYSKNKGCILLVEAAEYYAANQHGYKLYVVAGTNNEDYSLAVADDAETNWFKEENPLVFFVEDSTTTISENPLIIPVLSQNHPPTHSTRARASRKKPGMEESF